MTTDVTLLCYEDWVSLVFDHPVDNQLDTEPWYWRDGQEYLYLSPTRTVAYLTRMCREMVSLTDRFSLPQINQGIWFLFSGFPCTEAITDLSVPLTSRIECIRSMLIPYRDVVAPSRIEVMENCFDMWWDILAHTVHAAHPPVEQALLDAMFETLVAILQLGDNRCEQYALHGLGHLQHPEGSVVFDRFLVEHAGQLDEAALAWIEECRSGTLM